MTLASKYYMIGIDVGTTHIKAVIFNEWGTEISKSVVGTPSRKRYLQAKDPFSDDFRDCRMWEYDLFDIVCS
jgi:sugar (pentulose or hexulose) kinase